MEVPKASDTAQEEISATEKAQFVATNGVNE